MKFTRLFNVFQGENELSDKSFIWLEDLCKFLKSKDAHVRIFNVKRTLSAGQQTYNNKTAVPVSSVLRYAFQNSDALQSCKYICNEVENQVLNTPSSASSQSSYDLYKLIAKTKFLNIEFLFENVEFDDSKLNHLIIEHKPSFTKSEWKKICWFENHFEKNIDDNTFGHSYDDIVVLKFEKYQCLLSTKALSENFLSVSQTAIKAKQKRIEVAKDSQGIEIVANTRHLPSVIDSELLSLFQTYCGDNVEYVICFDTVHSGSKNSVQIVLTLRSPTLNVELKDLSERAFYFLKRRHGVNIEYLYILKSDSIKQYIENGQPSRFSLRDDIEVNSVKGIIHEWNGDFLIKECEDESSVVQELCQGCYNESMQKPLSARTFDISTEWFTETPIEIQIILEKFINKNSLKKAKNNDVFLRQKLHKLYRLYDVLLNILNKKFIGVHQAASTDELLIEYKSINSVFNVTSSAGLTTSLTGAENKLKTKTSDDLCYFNTYIKQHPLLYKNVSGSNSETVNLRDCHVILMLDNLVRLRYTADPNPGESRSKQICTLPITLQGLPLDSEITQSWHGDDCDGTNACVCRRSTTLSQLDIPNVLLQLDEKQEHVHRQFFKLMTWGTDLWKRFSDEILIHIENAESVSHRDIDDSQSPEQEEPDVLEETDEKDEDDDLEDILRVIDNSDTETNVESCGDIDITSDNDDFISDLEMSFEHLSVIHIDESYQSPENVQSLLSSFGFSKFIVPPLLTRHPPPAVGKDDDMYKIKEILDDNLQKLGYSADSSKAINRILCGPDNKIGKCVMSLIDMDDKYKAFLPEFPLLHLRKSSITILFSAYKDAGLVQLLKFMRNDDHDDWKKLASANHIDTATRHVKRIALSLHLAFLVVFTRSLSQEQRENFLQDIETEQPYNTADSWSQQFESFLEAASKKNSTFALHVDMMKHCDNVVAISLAERLGGPNGYALLLATMKDSIRFLFVNNASSYAPFTVKLLYHHYSAGLYHKCLKETLFTTPFKESNRNYACDTKREIDHIEALKGFRSGSNISSVTCRMSLIDSLNEVKEQRQLHSCITEPSPKDTDMLGWEVTEVDEKHVLPTVELILRKGGLSMDANLVPFNVYTKVATCLPPSILDDNSNDTGEFLLRRFLIKERMFQMKNSTIPVNDIFGPQELISRAKRSKGVTIKRTVKSRVQQVQSERQIQGSKRMKAVEKETKIINCFSSANNACQALVKPDSSKPKVMKSIGMQRALRTIITSSINRLQLPSGDINIDDLMTFNLSRIPQSIANSMTVCAVEFAGIKFKAGHVKSGREYISYVQTYLNGLLQHAPLISKVVICEEKYSFTPDELKASTREQRKTSSTTGMSINHLKTGEKIINENVFNKEAVTKTEVGKQAVSNYLAKNIHELRFDQALDLIVDSELHLTPCTCTAQCVCEKYCTPILCSYRFKETTLNETHQLLSQIQQTKGEAEMSVIDWLIDLKDDTNGDGTFVSIISSGDIDAVYIHLFTVRRLWPRQENGKFKSQVFVILQKPRGKVDVYNITKIIEVLEASYHDKHIGVKVALSLCLGGNDFFPKFHLISHETILKTAIDNQFFRATLFKVSDTVSINANSFRDLIKLLYCQKKYKDRAMSYNNVRALTIGKTEDPSKKGGYNTNDPRRWLPPESAIENLAELFQLQIEYIETAGTHKAVLPNFLRGKCLLQNVSGEIVYDFGPDAHFSSLAELPVVTCQNATKRSKHSTPQRGARKKIQMTSTPMSRK